MKIDLLTHTLIVVEVDGGVFSLGLHYTGTNKVDFWEEWDRVPLRDALDGIQAIHEGGYTPQELEEMPFYTTRVTNI